MMDIKRSEHRGSFFFMKDSDTWQTPNHYLNCVYRVFDNLDIDVTAPSDSKLVLPKNLEGCKILENRGQKRINSKYYFTSEVSCFDSEWFYGTYFMNPPFSEPSRFLGKFIHEIIKHESSGIVLLKSGCIHNISTSPMIWEISKAICFHSPRLNFLSKKLEGVNGCDFDCVSVLYDQKSQFTNSFISVFSDLGETRVIN